MKELFVNAMKTINKGLNYIWCVEVELLYKKGVGYLVEERLKVFGMEIYCDVYKAKDIARTI